MPIVIVKILLHMSWSSKNINKMTNYKAVKFWSRIYVFSMFPGLGHNFGKRPYNTCNLWNPVKILNKIIVSCLLY